LFGSHFDQPPFFCVIERTTWRRKLPRGTTA
jgi:hypothetical protein